jgi:hypothetical protein
MNSLRVENGRRILLGDHTDSEAIRMLPIRFLCVEVWISVALP